MLKKSSPILLFVFSIVMILATAGCGNNEYPWEQSSQTNRSQYETANPFDYIVSSEDPNAPQWNQSLNNGNGGYEPKAADKREIITLDKTFHVAAGEEQSFENKIIYISSANDPSDDQIHELIIEGSLTFKNCLLLWEQNVEEQLPFVVKGSGELNLTDSYAFSHEGSWIVWKFFDDSVINFDHFQGDPWTTITGQVSYSAVNYSTVHMTILNSTEGASVSVNQSHNVWLEIYPMPGDSTIELAKNAVWSDLNLDSMWSNTRFDITDSYIYEQDIALKPNVNLTVENATDGFGLGWEINNDSFDSSELNKSCYLEGLGNPDGRYSSEVTDAKQWECGNSSLTLQNSRILTAWPALEDDVDLTVENSYLVDARTYGRNASKVGLYTIKNSTAEAPMALSGGQMYLENVQIVKTLNVNGQDSLIQGYNVTSFDLSTPYTLNESDGGRYQPLTQPF